MLNKDNCEATCDPNYIEETIETAGCTGQGQFFKDGLPDCGKCEGMKNESIEKTN
jgi:hypothetical protein